MGVRFQIIPCHPRGTCEVARIKWVPIPVIRSMASWSSEKVMGTRTFVCIARSNILRQHAVNQPGRAVAKN